MLYRGIMAVCSQIHTKHINTLCGQKVELLNVKLAVHIVTTGLYIKTVNLTRPSPSKLIHERKESPKLCLYHFYALLLVLQMEHGQAFGLPKQAVTDCGDMVD